MSKITIFVFVFLPVLSWTQSKFELHIEGQNGRFVPHADVRLDDSVFLSSDDKGIALIELDSGSHYAEIQAFGFARSGSFFEVDKESFRHTFVLKPLKELDELVVSGTLAEISRSKSPVAITVLTPKFFSKNPEPSVYGVIDQVNGIRSQMNCSVCNTGDIHINGMEGAYTMITIDGMPIVGGLSTVYGLQGIPSSLIERIEVIKGPASTLYGSEAVGGLINVITTDPASADKLSINSNISSYMEGNVDLGFTKKMGKVNMLLGVNYFKYGNPIDLNDDNFTDVTLQDRISVFNKWNIERANNRIANVAFRYVYEDRWGGEMQWTPEFRGGDVVYGESIWTNRYEIISNYQLPLKEKIIFQSSASRHEQNSVYGDLSYVAEQVIAFNQLNWQKRWGKNNITAGLAHRYTFYDDNTVATNSISDTVVINNPYKVGQPGIFLQNLILFSDKSQLLLGMRMDLHPQHGKVLSPRVNYKISPTEKLDFRFALGNGFRVVNLFAEEHAALTGARTIVIKETLEPETCYNASINVTKKFFTPKGLFTLDGNFFYTYFTNKINPDYHQNDNEIVYENLDGYAIYRGINLDARFKFEFPLTINAGITFLDAFQMNRSADGSLTKEVPLLTEGLSGSLSVSYLFPKISMNVDYTATGYGSMGLPVLADDFRADRSKPYAIHNLKLTKAISEKFDMYVGVKNIFNFMPPSYSIMRSFDPFDQQVDDPVNNPYGYTFDPAYVYAPNQGIRGYLGIKFKMK